MKLSIEHVAAVVANIVDMGLVVVPVDMLATFMMKTLSFASDYHSFWRPRSLASSCKFPVSHFKLLLHHAVLFRQVSLCTQVNLALVLKLLGFLLGLHKTLCQIVGDVPLCHAE